MSSLRDPRLLVVALGGRALRGAGGPAGPEAWLRELGRRLPPLAELVGAGFRLVVTHGRGLLRDEHKREAPGRRRVLPAPLDVRRAETQGSAGYLIQQVLGNLCRNRNVEVPIAVVVTRVRVDADDPAFRRPTRPVGPPRSAAEARRLGRERGWTFVGSAARGRRRVVPSPRPRRVLEADAIRRLADAGVVAIAAGGGGVPVVETALGYRGVEAVLQEDATAALLATALAADRLVFLTGVDRAEVGHRTARAIGIERLSVKDARALLAAGEFPPGSMGPKIQGAIEFVEAGGREAIITSLPDVRTALDGRAGTRVVP
jgi:carbamate kinase